jgi:signal transduction histidine kinase
MSYEFSTPVVILLLTAVVAAILAIFSWQWRSQGDWARPFTAMAVLAGWWAFAYALEIAATNPQTIIFWAKLEYIGITLLPVAWFIFAIRYTNRAYWLSRNWLLTLLVPPTITLLLIFTNEQHNLMWQTVAIDSFSTVNATYGPWFWLHSLYSYLLILGGTLVMLLAYARYPKPYRRQNIALVLGALVPWLANVTFILGIIQVDLSPIAFTLSELILAIAIFRYQLFSVVPIARRIAVEFMNDGLIVLDAENRIIDLNLAAKQLLQQLSHTPTDDVISQPIRQFLQNQPHLLAEFSNAIELSTELVLDVNGEPGYFDLHISPLLNNRNQPHGRIIVFHDITKGKQAEMALAQARDEALAASQFKTELLARVSHELRTPLNVILGYSEMLQEGIFGSINHRQRDSTQKIIDSTEFLTKQVNELLDLARLDAGSLKLELVAYEPLKIIQQVQARMQILAEAKNLMITLDIEPCLPVSIMGDPVRLEQIVVNLVGNAIKFSDEGVIAMRVFCPQPGYWAIEVADSGMGIPDHMHELIFEPFRRVDGSLTRLHAGTGLGLAIVKQLTELMHGQVFLESKVNHGSRFVVQLPLMPILEGNDG